MRAIVLTIVMCNTHCYDGGYAYADLADDDDGDDYDDNDVFFSFFSTNIKREMRDKRAATKKRLQAHTSCKEKTGEKTRTNCTDKNDCETNRPQRKSGWKTTKAAHTRATASPTGSN